ncbi:MAG: 16S rRNA (guanine(527)-N(7))-methyltransferase RsmG [Acidobacteriota bacterium]
MDLRADEAGEMGERLNRVLAELGQEPLAAELAGKFGSYCALLLRWNARTNLTAVRDEDGILRRHMAESIACARSLPAGIRTLLDLGSGAGFPGLPIALCRGEIAVTLAESQNKKAAFLREAVRALGVPVRVHAGRGELLRERFDCVTLRAVDRMADAVGVAAGLVGGEGWLAVMTTAGAQEEVRAAAGAGFAWGEPVLLAGGTDRVLLLGWREG